MSKPKYRFLKKGELLQAGDEFLVRMKWGQITLAENVHCPRDGMFRRTLKSRKRGKPNSAGNQRLARGS